MLEGDKATRAACKAKLSNYYSIHLHNLAFTLFTGQYLIYSNYRDANEALSCGPELRLRLLTFRWKGLGEQRCERKAALQIRTCCCAVVDVEIASVEL